MPGRIGFRVTEDEYKIIKKNAEQANLGVSAFLREVGQGIIPQSRYDHEAVRDLIKVSVNLSKLGNLLKMALHNDIGWRDQNRFDTISSLFKEIDKTKKELQTKVKNLC